MSIPIPPKKELEADEPELEYAAMDQFSAHMDRGWDLVQKGDVLGAEASARRALDLENESPEAHNLLGFIAAMRGEVDDAREHYEQAIALDDTYLEAILNAAELCIHPLGAFEEAERLCDEALDLCEDADERVDALLLKFDALMGQERLEAAKKLCARFPTGPFDNPVHPFLMGRALFEVGEVARAAPLIEEATQTAPDNAEAYYYLALVREEQGKNREATDAFLQTLELDSQAAAPPWTLTRGAFHRLVLKALQELPAELANFVATDDVFVAPHPGFEVVADGVDPRSLLLLDEAPESPASKAPADQPKAQNESSDPAAKTTGVRLFVYQRNLERVAGSFEQLPGELARTLQQEIAAYLARPEGE